MKKQSRKLLALAYITFTLFTGRSFGAEGHRPRNQEQCTDIGVDNIISWFKYEDDYNAIDERIGAPRDQRDSEWCFAYAARDLIHYESGESVDPYIVAKNYYTHMLGRLSGLFSNNRGGFNYTNLKQSLNRGICEEFDLDREVTHQNIRQVKCKSPLRSIRHLGRARQLIALGTGRGHDLFYKLDELLSNNKMAIISYKARRLFKKKYHETDFLTNVANHASPVVGRYYDTRSNKCRYIVRNTLGTDYIGTLEGPQRAGYHSIDELQLSLTMLDLNWIENE